MALHHFLPQDRLDALASGRALPERADGAVVFVDIAGFTRLTESLTVVHGQRRGIEALSQRIDAVYQALIDAVEGFGGSVVAFAGDAVTCWFDGGQGAPARRAAAGALAMQRAMSGFEGLSVKVGVAAGPVQRLVVGDPAIHCIDLLTGATVARAIQGERAARAGEVLVDEATAAALAPSSLERRDGAEGVLFVLESGMPGLPEAAPASAAPVLDAEQLRSWVLPFVVDRETAGQRLFATDLRPTTALFLRLEWRDPARGDAAAGLLVECVAWAQREIRRHGGALLELSADGHGTTLYANFGAAQVHEDDAARALRAAVALRALPGADDAEVRIGLSSGTMRVGGYGSATRRSFGAIGDDVNIAARLMGQAQPGEILISGRLAQAAADEFDLEARSPIPVKGKAEPMPVYAVEGLRQQRGIRLQEPVPTLPLVGREAEIDRLARALAAAGQGHGQVLGITADAGMGKSRLVAEGVRLARRAGFIGYGGACAHDDLGTPYRAWQGIWTAFFDLDPALPQRRQLRAVQAELAAHAPEHADAWPLLGAVLARDWPANEFTEGLQPRDRKALLETLLLRCLVSAAREAAGDGIGLLLVLEDLHAADPLSLDLLAQLARAIEPLPVLMLLSYRPAEGGASPPAAERLAGLPHFAQIALDGLDAPQVEQVIRAKLAELFPQRVASVPPALIERITARAQGNPFFVEELLAYLHDRGIDPRHDAALEALELPASMHSLVLSRIDRLSPTQQRLLKAASVIGRTFRIADLQGYCPSLGEDADVARDLAVLDRLGFTPREPAETEPGHLFRHLVTLEAAYESIAHDARTELHGRYACYLEQREGERASTLAPQLAHHFARAGQRLPACRYLRLAGEQAAARFANEEALDCFQRALDWLPADDGAGRFELLLRCEAIHDLQGRHDARRRDLELLEPLAPVQPDPARAAAQVVARRAKLEIDAGDFAAARQAAQAARIETDAPLHVDALLLEVRAMFFAGQAPAAWPLLEQALALARAHGYARGEYNAMSQMGLLLWQSGSYDAAEKRLGQALPLIEAAGDARPQIDILNNLGVVAKARSRHAQAVGHYEQAQRLARRIGDRPGEGMLLINMSSASMVAGDFAQAGRFAEQAQRIFVEVNEPVKQGLALINRAEAHRELGQYAQALDLSGQALALMRARGMRRGEAVVLENRGLSEAALGRLDDAVRLHTEALSVAREIGARANEASILHHLGLVHLAAGRLDPAAQALDAAAMMLGELQADGALLEVRAAQAQLALAQGARGEALAQIEPLLPRLLAADTCGLPLAPYLAAAQVLDACGDARAAAVRERARCVLRDRAGRIADPASRRDYLNVAEHRAIAHGGGPAP